MYQCIVIYSDGNTFFVPTRDVHIQHAKQRFGIYFLLMRKIRQTKERTI